MTADPQPTLFDMRRTRHGPPRFVANATFGNKTGPAAAESVRPHSCPQARRILRMLLAEGAMIQEQIAARGFKLQSVNPRINRLCKLGYVKKVDEAPNADGHLVNRYAATLTGREFLAAWKKEHSDG